MDAPDAALCRCGAHPGMSHGRGAGSELAFVAAVGCVRGTGSRTVGTRNLARSYRPACPRPCAVDPHVPEWWAPPTQEVGQHRIGGNFSKIGEFAAGYYIP
jgi:hypothetical protein